MSWLSQGIHGIENYLTGHQDKPDPRKFSTPTPTMPQTTSPNTALPGIPNLPSQTLPMANAPSGVPGGMPAGFNEQQFENTLRTDPDLAGIWQGITNAGGDVWGVLKNVLPKNADGSVNWGAIGSDVAGFLKNNSKTILDGLAAYANYQRQNKSDAYAKQALQMAQDTYNQNAPLRDQGRANMLNPSANTPDLSAIKALATQNSGNPFAKGLPMASIATKPGQVVPPIPAPQSPGAPSGAPSPRLPMAPPQQPLTNPVPTGPGHVGATLQMAGDPNAPPTIPTSSTLAPRPKPLALAPQSPALAAPPLASGLQPSRAVLPFAYE